MTRSRSNARRSTNFCAPCASAGSDDMSTTAPRTSQARPSPKPTPSLWDAVRSILKPIASLQLTVGLLALSLGLVFFGTVAQVDFGIWTVVNKYFYSWVAWVPFQLFVRFGQKFLDVDPNYTVS